jgi:hypothetical protein
MASARHPHLAEQNPLSITLGRVHGGQYDTMTAAEAVLNGCAYFGSEVGSVFEVMEPLRAAVQEANAHDPLLKEAPTGLFFVHHDDTSEGPADAPIVSTLVDVARHTLGQPPRCIAATSRATCATW